MQTKTFINRLRQVLAAVLTIAALAAGHNSAWAQATQEVGVLFGYQQNGNYYRYIIHPWNLSSADIISEYQTDNYVGFNNQEYNIGDNNIPLTMEIDGYTRFTNANNFTVMN